MRSVERFLASGAPPRSGPEAADSPAARARHMAVRRVTEDFEAFSFHTAVAHLMEFGNHLEALVADPAAPRGRRRRRSARSSRLLHPIAPHLTEELNERMGGTTSLLGAGWPAFDPALAVEELATVVVQVGGKVRGQLRLARGSAEADAVAAAERDPNVAKWLEGKARVKTVWVPDRLLNVVVR